jgi:CHAD domain-containing protein
MNPFLEQSEKLYLQQLEAQTDSETQRIIQVLLLADSGLSARQVGERVGLSRSGVFYWVWRFKRLHLAALPEIAPSSLNTKTDSVSLENAVSDDTSHSKDSELALPSPLAKPGILPDDSLAEAGRKAMLYHFAQMLSKQAGTVAGDDIEFLHDMRVATRRLRAAIDVFGDAFKPKVIKNHLKGLRSTGRALGKVRDLDVFMEKVEHYLIELPTSQHQGLDPLTQNWQQQREQSREEMIAYFESSEYQKFVRSFNRFVQTTGAGIPAHTEISVNESTEKTESTVRPSVKVRDIAPLLIYTRLAAVSSYDKILPFATLQQLHALRIDFKKLRYTLEFLSEVLGPEAKQVINEIKIMQDHLGDLNDANLACDLLGKILAGWENQHNHLSLSERPDPGAVVAYLAYRAQERHQLMSTFTQAWENFNRPEVRHNLALAIARL